MSRRLKDIIIQEGYAISVSEVRRMIIQGRISVDGAEINPDDTDMDLSDSTIINVGRATIRLDEPVEPPVDRWECQLYRMSNQCRECQLYDQCMMPEKHK
jgi:predicted rRNA methylase YqxC with S4 and FtsJ domains